MSTQNDNILHSLKNMRLKKSVSLSVDEKSAMLKSVFDTAQTLSVPMQKATPSPFFFMITRYALPAFILGFIGLQYGDAAFLRAKLAYQDFSNTKQQLALMQTSAEIKDSLSKTTRDITALKSSEIGIQKEVLATEVSSGARSIRNQVAALVKENKITEAKQVVLTLETALKADELYKVSTSVQDEVVAATDLRVSLEKKEALASTEASTTASTSIAIEDRIKTAYADIEILEQSASESTTSASTTIDLFIDAKKYVAKAKEYAEAKDVENTIISLQVYDRIVAEIKLILLK